MGGPHDGQPVLQAGERLEKARAAMLLVHGRGASAADILTIGGELQHTGFAYLAPEAADHTWYPNPFTAPIATNEPHFSSALSVLEALLENIGRHVPPERTILLGFSQGACLVLEFAARHAHRYGGVIGFSGGPRGPGGPPRDYPGSFGGTPRFIGCRGNDPPLRKQPLVQGGGA